MKEKIVKCMDCGAKIEYKTNPPKRCKACKEKKDSKKGAKKRARSPKSSKTSAKEKQMFQLLDGIFPGEYFIRNGYYSFLLSPKGQPMQLDIYYPDRKLAFE